jgi:catechol-2,3-dioxygenase
MFKEIEGLVSAFERGRLSRRGLMAHLGVIVAAAAGARGARAQQGEQRSTFQANGLNHIALRVRDIGKARDFYVQHLGLTVTSESRQSCFLDCGEHFLALFRASEPGLDHYCYTIPDYEPAKAVETLKAAGLEPVRREDRVYFPDADGLEVQVAARNE